MAAKGYKGSDVENAEVQQWAFLFKQLFPAESYFPDATIPEAASAYPPGLVVFGPDDYELQLKDWRDPIKQLMNVGGKRVTALIYFAGMGKAEEVEHLLGLGADVNKLSSSHDSALLVALRRITEYGHHDLRIFELLSSTPHNPETLNTPTDKRKYTILGCAVDTLIPSVVGKILSMGAEPNQCCDVDQVSPLYKAIRSFASQSAVART